MVFTKILENGSCTSTFKVNRTSATYLQLQASIALLGSSLIDLSAFSGDFLQRIVIPPSASLNNGAQLDGNVLKVSIDLNFQQSINNPKLACVLVEDSVTGSGPQYYQANYYSGGTSLVDVDGTDWNAKPSNVPDYMMVYRHVARAISPSFLGDALPSNFYGPGDTETVCFEFIISGWVILINRVH